MDNALTLGPVSFSAFEVPEEISFGGRQRLAVHRLAGGGRVVDTLGWDAAPIGWSGIFSGEQASNRARQIEAMCASGRANALIWNVFCKSVVVSRFSAVFRSDYWIPYQIECTVLPGRAGPQAGLSASLVASEVADLTSATSFDDGLTLALASVTAANATVRNTLAYAHAQSTLAAAQGRLSALRTQAGSQLMAPDFSSALLAAGQLANAAAAFGYVSRAAVNLANNGG